MVYNRSCSVAGCFNKIKLHRFPKDLERRRKVIFLTGNKNLMNMNIRHVYKNARICENHFEGKFITRNGRLVMTALPTLNLPGKKLNISYTLKRIIPIFYDITIYLKNADLCWLNYRFFFYFIL